MSFSTGCYPLLMCKKTGAEIFRSVFFIEHLQWFLLKLYNYFSIHRKTPVPVPVLFSGEFFSFLQNTSVPLPLEPVDYLFLEPFFVSLDKSILPHRRYLLSKVSGILETFSELFPQLCVMYELVFSLLTWYILIGNIFLQSRLI